MIVAAVDPLLHKYVPPPVAVNVAVCPMHIVSGVVTTVGFAFTTTCMLSVLKHVPVPKLYVNV